MFRKFTNVLKNLNQDKQGFIPENLVEQLPKELKLEYGVHSVNSATIQVEKAIKLQKSLKGQLTSEPRERSRGL